MAEKIYKVLVVDDDLADMQNTLGPYLEKKNIQAKIVKNSHDALVYLRKNKPELILLDVFLEKGENGLNLLEKIRQNDKMTKIYIITAYADTYLEQARKLGANDYIQKPLTVGKIDTIICKALGVK